MKTQNIRKNGRTFTAIAGVAISALLGMASCDNKDYSKDSPFDNAVYIDAAKVRDVSNFTFKRILDTGKKEISAELAYPTDKDIEVSFKAAPALAQSYNARLGTNYSVLDAKHYKLSAQQAVIRKGESISKPISIAFSGLTELEIDAGYLLPVTIDHASGGMGTLDGSKTICYVVRRSSAITTAASLKGNYFEVPGFADGSPTATVVNGLKQLTYEAIVRVNKFENNISSVMGIEQYCLLRIGDANFPRQQLQFSGPDFAWKFPLADKSKLLETSVWYHVAFTWDLEKQATVMYVDGKEQSRNDAFASPALTAINLGKQKAGKDFMFKIGHSYGEPEDYTRQLDGEICEVRVWNTVRTQEEIWKNMYDLDPKTPGLKAYWKFNEGEGNTVKDQTGNGNDAIAHKPAVWPDGIEVPQKNKE